jgi:hypothetical protein
LVTAFAYSTASPTASKRAPFPCFPGAKLGGAQVGRGVDRRGIFERGVQEKVCGPVRPGRGLDVGLVVEVVGERGPLEAHRDRVGERSPRPDLEKRHVPRRPGASVDVEDEAERGVEGKGIGGFGLVEIVGASRVLA